MMLLLKILGVLSFKLHNFLASKPVKTIVVFELVIKSSNSTHIIVGLEELIAAATLQLKTFGHRQQPKRKTDVYTVVCLPEINNKRSACSWKLVRGFLFRGFMAGLN